MRRLACLIALGLCALAPNLAWSREAQSPITKPVWLTPPTGPGIVGDAGQTTEVLLTCRVAGEALTQCRPVAPMPDELLNPALRATEAARIADADGDGVNTNGRDIRVPIAVLNAIPVSSASPRPPPTWIERPKTEDIVSEFPSAARGVGMSGEVVLECIVREDGRLNCTVFSETPQGWGFGDAALRIAPRFRLATQREDGSSTTGGHVRLPITFTFR